MQVLCKSWRSIILDGDGSGSGSGDDDVTVLVGNVTKELLVHAMGWFAFLKDALWQYEGRKEGFTIYLAKEKPKKIENMEKLPSDITLDIFYRLPAETLVQCKFVCKSWRNIILYAGGGGGGGRDDATYFANMHLRRRRHHHGNNLEHTTFNFISMHRSRYREVEKFIEFHVTEYDDDDDQLSCKRINFPISYNFIRSGWRIGNRRLVGSCNGLICLSRGYGITYLEDAIGICNPLLKEYVTLPLSDTHFQSGSICRRDMRLGHRPENLKFAEYNVTIGFGYHPVTDEYKVVRVDYGHYSNHYIGDVEVYTLGDKSINGGMWKSKGTIDCRLLDYRTQPVLLHGSLHWLASKRILLHGMKRVHKQILSFDLKDEEFHMIPLPHFQPFIGHPLYPSLPPTTKLLELGEGCLCLIRTGGHEMDIWVLKDYMNKESWVKEFSMEWDWEGIQDSWCYSPCAIKKKKSGTDGDYEILLWCNRKSRLVSYDTKTRNFEAVGGVDIAGAQRALVCINSQYPVHHINSLVSLKALGEESSKNKGRWTRKRKKIVEGSWTRRHKFTRNIIVKAKASANRKKRKRCKALE